MLGEMTEYVPGIAFRARTDSTGRFQFEYVSEGVKSLLGLRTESFLDPEFDLESILHEADAQKLKRRTAIAANKLAALSLDLRLQTSEGGMKWFSVTANPVRLDDGDILWNALALDISDRRRSEEKDWNGRRLYRSIFDRAEVAMGLVDLPIGRFIRVNKKFSEVVGYSNDDLAGMLWTEIFQPEEGLSDQDNENGLLQAERTEFTAEKKLIHKDGTMIWVSLSVSSAWDTGERSGGHIVTLEDITERKRIEHEFSRRKDFYRETAATTIAVSYRFEFNSDSYTFLDTEISSLLGYTSDEFVPGFWNRIIRQMTLRGELAGHNYEEAKQKYWAGECNSWVAEYECIARDGRTVWVFDTAIPVLGDAGKPVGSFGFLRDITERKRSEQEIQDTQTQLRSVLETASDLILSLDLEGNILYSNRDLSHISLPQGDEPNLVDLVPQKKRELIIAMMQSAQETGKSHEFEIQSHGRKSQSGWYLCRIRSVMMKSHPVGFTACLTDISQRRIVEETLAQRETELAHVSRLNTMGEMIAGIAHEINQPLFAIVNCAQACRNHLNSRDEEDVQMAIECSEKITGHASRSGEIIRRLSRFVKKRKSRTALVGVNELIEESLYLVANELHRGCTEVRLKLSSHSVRVSVDPIQVQQVLVNVLKNANEALQENARDNRHVVIETTARDKFVELTIRDNGPGLPEEEIVKMFDAFHSTKLTGMGVGLAISRRIVESLGGRMWASRGEEGGMNVSFTLPETE